MPLSLTPFWRNVRVLAAWLFSCLTKARGKYNRVNSTRLMVPAFLFLLWPVLEVLDDAGSVSTTAGADTAAAAANTSHTQSAGASREEEEVG